MAFWNTVFFMDAYNLDFGLTAYIICNSIQINLYLCEQQYYHQFSLCNLIVTVFLEHDVCISCLMYVDLLYKSSEDKKYSNRAVNLDSKLEYQGMVLLS